MDQEVIVNAREKALITNIGENIRTARSSIDMTIKELADLVGLSESFLGSVERGEKSTSIYNLSNICLVLNKKLDDIVFGPEFKKTAFHERPVESSDTKREKIKSLITNLDSSQLDYIIKSIKNLKEMEVEQNKK